MRGDNKLVSSDLVNIGGIPENWYVTKINYFSNLQTGGTPNKDILEYWANGNIKWMSSGEVNNEFIYETKNKITELGMKNSNASILPINSVMMALNGQGKTKGTVAVLKVETTCNQSLAAFIPDEKHLHYLYLYYFLKYNYKFIRGLVGEGLRDGISMGLLKSLKICLPTYEDQRTIGKFLYKKEQEIKTLIGQKESMIRLLEQQRQSIITEAVTKGLNPKVKMKDSGVEWIGNIPEHWEVKKVKHFATHVGSGKTPSGGSEVYLDEGVPFLRSLNVHFDGIRLKDLAFISEETNAEMKSSQVKPLDILLNITGASIGRTTIVPKDFGRANVNQHVCIIRLNQKKMYPYYFNMLMSSDVINQQIWFAQNGSSREGLNFVQVKELTFAVPPTLEEQRELNEWVFNKQQTIYDVMSTIKEQIEKLKEYRQALIYEAVTGKIDVRDMELN